MISPDNPSNRGVRKVLVVDTQGNIRHLKRFELTTLFEPNDTVIANDAATLPASLHGKHVESGQQLEVRLASWVIASDYSRFVAIVFGNGDFHTPTEHRAPPPLLLPGNHLTFGPLKAQVRSVLDHPRMILLEFLGERSAILAGLSQHGRPIQYAHISTPLVLWDVWTSLAAQPFAFESPSASFALDWQILSSWRQRKVNFATITHAAGISSTGDPTLDLKLPFDEPYIISKSTATLINQTKSDGRRVIAIGTSTLRALESAILTGDILCEGSGVARNRMGANTRLGVCDAILTGIHQPGDSHYELLRALVDEAMLNRIMEVVNQHDYRMHEFGDAMLIENQLPNMQNY